LEIKPQPQIVHIPCGAVILKGELYIPVDATGVVLSAHVSNNSSQNPRNQYLAQAIRKTGTGTLLFDLLTPEEEAQDTAAYLHGDIRFLAKRLIDVTKWVEEQPETQDFRIGYLGGGSVAAAALVAASELGGAIVSRGGWLGLARDSLQCVRSPTFLIVGEFDEFQIRPNEKAFTQLTCEKELRIVPGVSPLFEEEDVLEEMAGFAAGWFQQHLRLLQ